MALQLAITDSDLAQALKPLANSDLATPTLLVTDTPGHVATGHDTMLLLDREKWAALCNGEKPYSDEKTTPFVGPEHVIIYDAVDFAVERVTRTLERQQALAAGNPSAYGVAPLLEPSCGTLPASPSHADRRLILSRMQKVRALEDLIEFVDQLRPDMVNYSSHFVSYAIEIQEELLANAIWDANPRLCKAPRDGDFELAPHEAVELQWGFDGKRVAISVTDPFGTFPEALLQRYFRAIFDTGMAQRREVQKNGPGAGIGMYMLLQRATLLTLTLEPGKKTEFTAIMNVAHGSRGLMRGTHSLQYFRINTGANHGTR